MRRDTGIWANVRANQYADPRTAAAAAVLESGGVPSYVSAIVVVTAFHRLECWAMGDGDEGLTGHLEPETLAAVCWPEHVRGPRTYGRGERLGSLLRAALRATPKDGSAPYLTLGCAGGCEGLSSVKVRGVVLPTCIHERIEEWSYRPPKLIADRLDKRAKDLRKALAAADLGASAASAPVVPPPDPVVRPSTDSRPTVGRIPSHPIPIPEGEKNQSGIPAIETALADTARRGAGTHRAGDVVRALLAHPRLPSEGPSPGRAGSSLKSSAPGAGAGDGIGDRDAVARALLGAEPNLRQQVRSGRDLTLRPGAYYLQRIGMVQPERRRELEGEMGSAPAPGALLFRLEPARVDFLTRVIAAKWSGLRNAEAYVRSSLAATWTDVLARMDGAVEKARHDAALAAASNPPPPAAVTGA